MRPPGMKRPSDAGPIRRWALCVRSLERNSPRPAHAEQVPVFAGRADKLEAERQVVGRKARADRDRRVPKAAPRDQHRGIAR